MRNKPAPARWLASITYRTTAGPLTVDHGIEELDEIADLVEAGPDWDTIDRIEIIKGANQRPGFTIEQAAEE